MVIEARLAFQEYKAFQEEWDIPVIPAPLDGQQKWADLGE